MEEKKTNELTDETLDAVAGGATYKYDVFTKKWYVYKDTGSYYGEYTSECAAKEAARSCTSLEEEERNKRPRPYVKWED